MNCVPAPLLALVVVVDAWTVAAVLVDWIVVWATAAVLVDWIVVWATAAVVALPSSERAALSLGCALPNPQPPSTSWAKTGPAHLPVLKPQQPEAQSASLVQGPVMNCVP
jgi:hypothetical protein